MNLYVGVTDSTWFRFHAERKPDEVNFWRPGGEGSFAALEEGAPFLFKLHAPQNSIVGGGFFVRFTKLPLSMSWRVFGDKNGCATLTEFRQKLLAYRNEADRTETDPTIGCIVLAIPFFFSREMWMPAPRDWHPNIVQGKTYDTNSAVGKQLWDEVIDRLGRIPGYLEVEQEIRKEGPLYAVRGRIGQAGFRTNVMEAYHRRCAISQERTVPALEASHIRPYGESGPNRVNNGLLLRADLHQIFDEGYITITSDFHVQVSNRIRQEYENGREYYRFNGHPLLNLPDSSLDRPNPEFIEWHNQNVYRG